MALKNHPPFGGYFPIFYTALSFSYLSYTAFICSSLSCILGEAESFATFMTDVRSITAVTKLLWYVFFLVRPVQSGVKVSHEGFYLPPEYGLAPCFLVFPEFLVLFRKQLIPSLAYGFKLGVFTAGIYVYLSVVGVEIAVFRSVLAFRDAYIKTALFCVK